MQPERDGRNWTTTIVGQRLEIERHLGDNPGLEPKRPVLLATAYRDARKLAASEIAMELRLFPETPPFKIEQAGDEEFWPKSVASGGEVETASQRNIPVLLPRVLQRLAAQHRLAPSAAGRAWHDPLVNAAEREKRSAKYRLEPTRGVSFIAA